MTNEEMFHKVKRELPQYQIGFHQIALYKYFGVVGTGRVYDFKINDENVTTEKVAQQIQKKGFHIWDPLTGLCSTAYFCRKFEPDTFNYRYYSKETDLCNVLFAIPYYLTYGDRNLFIGNLSLYFSVGEKLLFNDFVPPEFIYGYYKKKCSFDLIPTLVYNFSENLDFYENERFWTKLSFDEQKEVLQKLFSRKTRAYKALRLANNHSQLSLLSCNDLERLAIKATRRQKKAYVKQLKY